MKDKMVDVAYFLDYNLVEHMSEECPVHFPAGKDFIVYNSDTLKFDTVTGSLDWVAVQSGGQSIIVGYKVE